MPIFVIAQHFHFWIRLLVSLVLVCCFLSASELSGFASNANADTDTHVKASEFQGYCPFKERLGIDRRPNVLRGNLPARDLFSAATGAGSFEFRFRVPDPFKNRSRVLFRPRFRPLRGLPFCTRGRAPPCSG